jgi:hypothetical protein
VTRVIFVQISPNPSFSKRGTGKWNFFKELRIFLPTSVISPFVQRGIEGDFFREKKINP